MDNSEITKSDVSVCLFLAEIPCIVALALAVILKLSIIIKLLLVVTSGVCTLYLVYLQFYVLFLGFRRFVDKNKTLKSYIPKVITKLHF